MRGIAGDGRVRAAFSWLLRVPLFTKILVANSVIVVLGAVAAILLVDRQVPRLARAFDFTALALVGLALLVSTLVANALVLGTALIPLRRLERIARRVQAGDLDARATPGTLGDPATDRLAAAFNAMLDTLAARTAEVEGYSRRLRALSDRVLLAQEEERSRVSSDLLDRTGQDLAVLLLGLRALRGTLDRLVHEEPALGVKLAGAFTQVDELIEVARTGMASVREMAGALRPRTLDDLGLAATLRAYVEEWSAHTGIEASLASNLDRPVDELRIPTEAKTALYRLVQETLANAARGDCFASVRIRLAEAEGMLILTVTGTGRGAAAGDQRPEPAPPAGTMTFDGGPDGVGWFGVQEKIALAGGTLDVRSAPGQGMTVTAKIPLTQATLA